MQQLNEKQILVLQGGGALGAYQAGAYEALAALKHKNLLFIQLLHCSNMWHCNGKCDLNLFHGRFGPT
jgi:hypothetical protein